MLHGNAASVSQFLLQHNVNRVHIAELNLLLSMFCVITCGGSWRECEERKCQDPEECLEPSGRKSSL